MKDLGRQVYLGGYEAEEHAAEAYDVAALKCKGPRVKTNFTISRCALGRTAPHGCSLLAGPRLSGTAERVRALKKLVLIVLSGVTSLARAKNLNPVSMAYGCSSAGYNFAPS